MCGISQIKHLTMTNSTGQDVGLFQMHFAAENSSFSRIITSAEDIHNGSHRGIGLLDGAGNISLIRGIEFLQLVRTSPAAQEYHLVTGVLLLICAAVATIGNAIVIAVIVRVRRYGPDTVTHILILNLASTHLLLSLLCTPLEAAFYLAGSRWLIGEVTCRIVGYLKSVFVAAAVITLSNIAVDRYYSVVYPMERKITTVKRHMMVCYTWVHAVIICIPYCVGLNVGHDYKGRPYCDFHWSVAKSQAYLIAYSTLTIFFPLIVTSLAYYLVWQAFRQSQRKVNVASALKRSRARKGLPFASKTEIRLLKTLLLMVFCFVMLWTPYLTYLFISVFSNHVLSEYFILTSVWISRVQPVLDPLIYGYLNNHFKRRFFEMLNGFAAVRCCKLPEVAVTTNEKPTISSEQRRRVAYERGRSSVRRALPAGGPTIETITNVDGPHPQARLRGDVYLPLDMYVRRAHNTGPITTSKVFVQSTSNPSEERLLASLGKGGSERERCREEDAGAARVGGGGGGIMYDTNHHHGRNESWNRCHGNTEPVEVMDETHLRVPTTVKVGISSVPSWAFSSTNTTGGRSDTTLPSVVIQHAQEEILRIDYFDRYLRNKPPSENMPTHSSSDHRRTAERFNEHRESTKRHADAENSLPSLPKGGPLRSPHAVKRLPPIRPDARSKSQLDFCDNDNSPEVRDSEPRQDNATTSLTVLPSGSGSGNGWQPEAVVPSLRRQRKKRRNFLLSRARRKTAAMGGEKHKTNGTNSAAVPLNTLDIPSMLHSC